MGGMRSRGTRGAERHERRTSEHGPAIAKAVISVHERGNAVGLGGPLTVRCPYAVASARAPRITATPAGLKIMRATALPLAALLAICAATFASAGPVANLGRKGRNPSGFARNLAGSGTTREGTGG